MTISSGTIPSEATILLVRPPAATSEASAPMRTFPLVPLPSTSISSPIRPRSERRTVDLFCLGRS